MHSRSEDGALLVLVNMSIPFRFCRVFNEKSKTNQKYNSIKEVEIRAQGGRVGKGAALLPPYRKLQRCTCHAVGRRREIQRDVTLKT